MQRDVQQTLELEDTTAVMPAAARPVRKVDWRFAAGLAAVVLLALAVQEALFYKQVFWISADESGRTEHAWLWAAGPRQPLDVWPPLPKIVTGLALKYASPDLFLTPRVVTGLFALAALAALLALAHELFASKRITLAAGALAAIYSHRAVLAVVPLAEMQYFTWLLWAQVFALRAIRRGEPAWHLAAAAGFALAMMTRYEAWIFSGFYGLVLLAHTLWGRRVPWRVTLGCGALLAAFPLAWMAMFAQAKGDPLGFMKETSNLYRAAFGNVADLNYQRCAFRQLYDENMLQFNLAGALWVAIWVWRLGSPRSWIIIPAGAYVVIGLLGWMGKAMPVHNFWRIASIWGLMLIPFTAAACVEIIPREAALGRWWERTRPLLGALLLGTLIILFARDTQARMRRFKADPAVLAMGAAMRGVLEEERKAVEPFKVLLENTPEGHYLHIQVLAGSFDDFILHTRFERENALPPLRQARREDYLKKLNGIPARLIALRSEDLKKKIEGAGVREIKRVGPYTIYALTR